MEALKDVAFASLDLSPEGKRFLMAKNYGGNWSKRRTALPKINIVLNWFEELKQKVPVD